MKIQRANQGKVYANAQILSPSPNLLMLNNMEQPHCVRVSGTKITLKMHSTNQVLRTMDNRD